VGKRIIFICSISARLKGGGEEGQRGAEALHRGQGEKWDGKRGGERERGTQRAREEGESWRR
jgi:hypothetical protein